MVRLIRQGMIFWNAVASVMGGLVFLLTYITAADLNVQQLIAAVGGGAVLLFLVTGPIQYGSNEIWFRPIFQFIRKRERRETVPEEVLEAAYSGVLRFPIRAAFVSLAMWTIPTAFFVFVFLDRFGVSRRQQVYLWAALANAGLVGLVFQFFLFKRALAPVAGELAHLLRQLPSAITTQPPILSIRLKIYVSFLALLSFSLIFLSLLSFSRFEKVHSEHIKSLALQELSNIRGVLLPVHESPSDEWAHAVRSVRLTGQGRPFLLEVSGKPISGPPVPLPALRVDEAWSKTSAEEVWVATRLLLPPVVLGIVYPRSEFVAVGRDFAFATIGVGLFTLAFGFVIAFLAAVHVSGPVKELGQGLSRAARGYFGEPRVYLGGDEVDGLSRSIRSMVRRMHAQLSHVREGAVGMAESARRTFTASRAIHAESRGQLIDAEDASKLSGMIASNTEMMNREVKGLRKVAEDILGFFTSLVGGMDRVDHSGADLRASIQEFSPMMEKVMGIADQMSGQTGELARFSDETAAATTQAHASARNVERVALEASALILSVREAAERGEEAIRSIAAGMGRIQQAGESVLTLIEELDGLFREVKWIIHLIGEVAEDADILALNAEIISEQVGERGGGFSIVAQEVGNLAYNTQSYTRTVTGHLERVERMEKSTLIKVGEMNKVIQEAIFYANELSKTFQLVLEHTQRNAGVAQEIANACREQATGSERITTAMVQMNQTVEQISSDAERMRACVERIRTIAGRLNEGSEALSERSRRQKAASEEARTTLSPLLELVDSIARASNEQGATMGAFQENVNRLVDAASQNATTTDGLENACARIEGGAEQLEAQTARIYLEKA
ncbi:MAG: hypothetical protein HYT87_17845 [Nitrospirae bacterium]|nr:hypothetical protein [Nitrospirota bacterium]